MLIPDDMLSLAALQLSCCTQCSTRLSGTLLKSKFLSNMSYKTIFCNLT